MREMLREGDRLVSLRESGMLETRELRSRGQ